MAAQCDGRYCSVRKVARGGFGCGVARRTGGGARRLQHGATWRAATTTARHGGREAAHGGCGSCAVGGDAARDAGGVNGSQRTPSPTATSQLPVPCRVAASAAARCALAASSSPARRVTTAYARPPLPFFYVRFGRLGLRRVAGFSFLDVRLGCWRNNDMGNLVISTAGSHLSRQLTVKI